MAMYELLNIGRRAIPVLVNKLVPLERCFRSLEVSNAVVQIELLFQNIINSSTSIS